MDAITSTLENRDITLIDRVSDKLEKHFQFERFARECRQASQKLQAQGLIEVKEMKRSTEFDSDDAFITYVERMKKAGLSVTKACEQVGHTRDDFYNAKKRVSK